MAEAREPNATPNPPPTGDAPAAPPPSEATPAAATPNDPATAASEAVDAAMSAVEKAAANPDVAMSTPNPAAAAASGKASDALAAARAAIAAVKAGKSAAASSASPSAHAGAPAAQAGAEVAGQPMPMPAFKNGSPVEVPSELDLLADVNLNVKIELGRTHMLVEDVLRLGEGSVVELDKLAGDPVDIYVNDRPIARGEVLVVNDTFCVRISEILDQSKSVG